MRINRELQAILNAAYQEAKQRNHEYLTPEHVLYAALHFDYPRDIVAECGVDPDGVRTQLDQHLKEKVPVLEGADPLQSLGFQNVIERAVFHTEAASKEEVDIGDIIVSIFDEDESFGAYFLKKAGLQRIDLLQIISHGVSSTEREDVEEEDYEVESDEAFSDTDEEEEGAPGLGEAEEGEEEGGKAKKKDALAKFTTDLTEQAREGRLEPLIGREDILERTVQVLCRRMKNNPVHLGDPGVGKTAITEGLAQRIADGTVPSVLKDYSVLALDMGGMLAGTRYRGDFEERMKQVIKALEKRDDVILFIDEIHTVVGAGAVAGGSMDASNMLKPALSSGRIRCVGSTTYEEYKKYFEKDRALSRRFQKIEVSEPSEDETVEILKGLRDKYEEYHNVTYTDDALEAAVHLSHLYITDRHLPDKAIDVIDEAGAYIRMRVEASEHDAEPVTISEHDIEKVVSRIAKIPERSVGTSEKDRLAHLDKDLHQVVFGQDDAIASVVEAVKRSRAGFRNPDKPVANFLFVGPTGVGKTELARQLSSTLGVAMHRFDMSEYQEKHTVSRLIGSPPGYVGYEEGALLTDAIRKTPHAVLLLDEIEKAHQDIFNILLSVMDYATMTDNTGKKADFRNVIIIMTSNAGAREIGKPMIGFGERQVTNEAVNDAVQRIFSPEFRNRLDKVVIFNALATEVLENIVSKEIKGFNSQLAEKKVEVEVSPAALKWLAEHGYSEEFGARNISRLVEDKVKAFFVDAVLFGELEHGGTAVVDVEEDDIVIRAEGTPQPEEIESDERPALEAPESSGDDA
ncbi:MAG: ATP-dependent Clp protease ATP-binding subunit ClpA [Spirochaetes bacterium]|jgi:ATP-dependent Clp protease ATP-binding subunit ClpA|nr:ATP-dependent Clp protease ATP-binding subunit ClpA [Spirochaetota bacterium]